MRNIVFGTDYYPEHWPRERWETDARMMREMGLDVVRMAEFSWAKMEPALGEFHFEWLDEAIAVLAKEGIVAVLGTPTAAPPAWICERDPEIEPMDENGQRLHFGGRHHDCQSNAAYREHCRRIVTAMAEHFKDNPNVVGWQIDNELGNSHDGLCFCPSCEARFREWLRARYGDIDSLNRAWGTAFWSQQYASFEQIHAPRRTVTGRNPSQALDWKRFTSDLVCDFSAFQVEILRRVTPDKFITHNMMGFAEKVDYRKLSEQYDFASHDQYPGGFFRPGEPDPAMGGAALDYIRSLKKAPFWLMEQQSAITGWQVLGRTPRPGQLGLWAAQTVAHGADTIVFFRWRSCAMGTEQYWHGILPHNGVPGRYHAELSAFIRRFKPLMEKTRGSMPRPETALLFSYDEAWAMGIQPHHPDLRYTGHLLTYYRALQKAHVPVDFVSAEEDYAGYRLLVAPLMYLMTPDLAARLRSFAEQGGTLVIDMRFGVKDGSNLAHTDVPLPGLAAEMCGMEITEFDCLRNGPVAVSWGSETYEGRLWADLIELKGAEALASYASEFYAGTPCVTRNRCGKGWVYYVGTEMDEPFADRLIAEAAASAGVAPLPFRMEGLECTLRQGDQGEFLFLLNHTDEAVSLPAEEGWRSALPDQGDVIPPYGAFVYTRA